MDLYATYWISHLWGKTLKCIQLSKAMETQVVLLSCSVFNTKKGSPYCYMWLLWTDLMYMWSEFQVDNLGDSCIHVRLWRNVNQCNWLFYDLRECRVLQVDQMSALWAWITPQELHSNCFILGLLKPNKLGKASHLQQETPAFLHLKVSEPFVVVTIFLLSTSWISLCLVSFERFGQWRSQCFALKACNIRIQHHWVVYLIHSASIMCNIWTRSAALWFTLSPVSTDSGNFFWT